MIAITERAARQIVESRGSRRGAKERPAVRLVLRNAGTARAEYTIHFVDAAAPLSGELVHELGELRLHVASASAPFLAGALLDYVEGPEGGFRLDAPRAAPPPLEGSVFDQVNRVIDERINPAVAVHGGEVTLVAVEGEAVYLRLGGGCQGCDMVSVTLKESIDTMIREAVPGIRRVLDVTDHAGGSNPYYRAER